MSCRLLAPGHLSGGPAPGVVGLPLMQGVVQLVQALSADLIAKVQQGSLEGVARAAWVSGCEEDCQQATLAVVEFLQVRGGMVFGDTVASVSVAPS